ncbi:DNA/RNA polymerase, partial [Gloeophyllum trabeum ATCC 11539]
RPPPSASTLLSTLDNYGLPAKIYRDPYYSNEADVPEKPREYAGLVYHLKGGEDVANLEEWQCGSSCDYPGLQKSDMPQFDRMGVGGWEYASSPPSRREVEKWLRTTSVGHRSARRGRVSEAAGSSQHNVTKAKKAVNNAADANRRERQNMTILSFEILALSRGDLVPDADVDEIVVAFYSFQGEDEAAAPTTGFIAVEDVQLEPKRLRDVTIDFVPNELELLNRVVDQVSEYDPDILVGWEIQASSWGYLNVRGRAYGLDITELLSRAPARRAGGGNHQWGLRTTSTFSVVGRHVLNLWRIMRSEYTLAIYTFENVAFNVLHKRIPHYGHRVLTSWFRSNVPNHTMQALRHMSNRTLLNLEILDRAEFITKTAEFARIFGVDFFSVISRGSQFKVESFMFRIAKPESFVLISPSKQDVGKQNAAECMPLIMEPLSAFYNSPLVVLDFQSLYPSIMIAYNYCYSTCLGRVVDFKGRNKFGVSELHLRPGLLDTLKDHIHIAPNGMMYVKPEVRKGLLGRMLTELLETRVMVKQAMKSAKDDKILRRVLDARQLALKFIANVTYGYTSATYSGRMPAVEIADSIVQSGRETLEKAIRIIDSTKKWGARVVYGDTDSLFIYLRGKTKEQAFRIGHDIADTITRANPAPVKLKFEKVYLPCVLMAKKRYVGFKYENPDDVEPVFDAKGIETVRRDGIPAQRKMTEDCLRILFQTQDLSKVKEYCWRAWSDVLENRISIQDFIFAKEVKMGTYSEKAPPPPGVTVAARRMMEDEANEPQYGERVRYVIVKGGPHSRLVDRAVAPEELLDQRHKRLDANYYISNVLIPPLERIFNLVGADVRSWYDEMPKAIKVDPIDPLMLSPKKRRDATLNRLKIEEHFQNSDCIVCGASTSAGLCEDCVIDPQPTITSLLSQVRAAERRLKDAHEVCSSCALSPRGEPILCDSLDCSWLFER